jgi:hypothetical protein
MLHVKKFLEKMTLVEAKQNKDLVLPINDARGLRDDIAKLLSDYYEMSNKQKNESVIDMQIKGGSFK